MPWIKFSDDYDFSPEQSSGNLTIAYKKGCCENVTTECANKAVSLGKAARIKAPEKKGSERDADKKA